MTARSVKWPRIPSKSKEGTVFCFPPLSAGSRRRWRTPRKSVHTITICVGLLLCCFSVRAQQQRFGDWIVVRNQTIVFAKTENQSHDGFAKVCHGEMCDWFIFIDNPCTPKQTLSNILINSDRGSDVTKLTCIARDPKPSYVFEDESVMNRCVSDAHQVSVVVPLSDGLVKVSTFSLGGMENALHELPSNNKRTNVLFANPIPQGCSQLSSRYFSCKSEADSALQKCAVWHGPGGCPDSVPVCTLPSAIDPHCTP